MPKITYDKDEAPGLDPVRDYLAKIGRKGGAAKTPRKLAAVAKNLQTRCPVCGSSDRGPYNRVTETLCATAAPDGNPATHIVRRWTACKSCGQARIDRSYENRLTANASKT